MKKNFFSASKLFHKTSLQNRLLLTSQHTWLPHFVLGALATGGIGSACYMQQDHSQEKEVLDFKLHNNKIIMSNQGCSCADPAKQLEIKSDILQSPLKILWNNWLARSRIWDLEIELKFRYRKDNGRFPITKAFDYNWKKINKKKKAIREKAQQSPILHVSECNYGECNLTRWRNPFCRNLFEKDVAQTIISKAKLSSTINYVNVGAGKLFQDMRIISEAFENGVKKINFFIIDPLYKHLVKDLIRQNNNPAEFSLNDINFKRFRSDDQERIKQFISWFECIYPQCTLEVYLYTSLEEYQNVLQQKSHLRADVLVASDLEYLPAYSDIEYSQVMKQDGIGMLLAKRGQVEGDQSKSPCYLIKTLKSEQVDPQDEIFDIQGEYTHLIKEYKGQSLNFSSEGELEAYLNSLIKN